MSPRPVVPWPNACLRSPAGPVGQVTDDHRAIWDEMVAVMEAMPGVGLAAPQLGIPLRLAVVDASDTRGQVIRLADPEIIATSDEMSDYTEASPNLPGVSAKITRPATVSVAFTDHMGMRVRQEFTGLWATSVQHQIDHLNGRMYFDNLSKVKRDMLLKKARKAR